jgi:hypothetical protein
VYSGHDPLGLKTSTPPPLDPVINYRGMVAPAATDIQISGAASNGSPSAGSTFTYTYQVHDARTAASSSWIRCRRRSRT